MRLTAYEWKKAVGSYFLPCFLCICTIVCGALCYSETVRDDSYFYIQKIKEEYETDPQSVRNYYEEVLMPLAEDYNRLLRAYSRGETAEEPVRSFPCTYSGEEGNNDYDLIRIFLLNQNRDKEWRKDLEKIIRRAEANKEELLVSYVNLDKSSFAYRRLHLIHQQYTDVQEKTVSLDLSPYGWDQVFGFDGINLFLFLSVAAGAIVIFSADFGKPSLVYRTTKKGRGQTAVAKTLALLLWTVLSVLLLYAAVVVSVYCKCGAMSELTAPLASFHEFRLMPYSFTVLEYALLLIGMKLLLASVLALCCALFCILLRSPSLGFLASAASVFICFLLYQVMELSDFRYLNFYGLSRFSEMTKAFRCVNLFRVPVPLLTASVFFLCLFLPLLASLTVLFFSRFRLANKELFSRSFSRKRGLRNRNRLRRYKRQKCFGTGLLSYEFVKLFFRRASVGLILLAVILKLINAGIVYDSRSGYQRSLYREYMLSLEGEYTAAKAERIEKENTRIRECLKTYPQMHSDFLQGKADAEEFHIYLEEFRYASEREEVVERILDHAKYLKKTEKRTGVSASFLFDVDWIRLFQSGSDGILILLLVFLFSTVFAEEYGSYREKTLFLPILRTAKHGRKRLFRVKLSLSVLSSLVLTLLFTVIDGAFIMKNFNLPSRDAPLLSLEIFGFAETSVTIIQALTVFLMIKLYSAALLGALSALYGILIKNRLYTLIASFSTAFVPQILYRFGVKSMADFRFTNGFDPICFLQKNSFAPFAREFGYILVFLSVVTVFTLAMYYFAGKEYCK